MAKCKADLGEVEIPSQLKPNFKRNYCPQQQRLDGYAQMPRMIAPPYANKQLLIKRDRVTKRRALRANNSVTSANNTLAILKR